MPLINAFLFDLDGTLVNTYEADFLAYHDAIKEVTGISIEQHRFNKTHGQEMRRKLADLTPDIAEDAILEIGKQKKVHYAKYLHLTAPNQPLIDFLHAQIQIQPAILVTSAKRQNAMLVLDKHNLSHYFTEMVFGDEVNNPKPHPEPYLVALKKAGLKPEEVIAFEDSDTGIASATAAGINVIKIGTFL